MKAVCRFKFSRGTKRQFIEESIASAIFNAECVFGKPKVRVSGVAYYVAENTPACIIDVSTDIGQHVAQVFTGIMINALGEEKFQVCRIEGEPGETVMAGEVPLKSQIESQKSQASGKINLK